MRGLQAVLRDVWSGPVLDGLPTGTRFEHSVEGDVIFAALITADCATTRALEPAAPWMTNAQGFAQAIDEFLLRLNRDHRWHICTEPPWMPWRADD